MSTISLASTTVLKILWQNDINDQDMFNHSKFLLFKKILKDRHLNVGVRKYIAPDRNIQYDIVFNSKEDHMLFMLHFGHLI